MQIYMISYFYNLYKIGITLIVNLIRFKKMSDTDNFSIFSNESEYPEEKLLVSNTTAQAARAALVDMMGALSEQCFQTAWVDNLSSKLWNCQPGPLGNSKITLKHVLLLQILSEEAKGWWSVDEQTNKLSFLTIDQWEDKIDQTSNQTPIFK